MRAPRVHTLPYASAYVKAKRKSQNKWLKPATEEVSSPLLNCVDPIINKDYGCFTPQNTEKASCIFNVLPSVLQCLFFGNQSTEYCISSSQFDIPCNGTCGYTRDQSRKIYSCAGSYGNVKTCDTNVLDFCDCTPSGKSWDGIANVCKCPDGKQDYGACCSDQSCNLAGHEIFSCDENGCICVDGYKRINNDPSRECVKTCTFGSAQNNPINSTDPLSGGPGCGVPTGTEVDLCCCNPTEPNSPACVAGMCVLDTGTVDPTKGGDTKAVCLQNGGVWRFTDNTKCPRVGYCEYTQCDENQAILILPPTDPNGPAWTFPCAEKCAIPSCESACKSHCGIDNYEKSECMGGTSPTCICTCKEMP